MNRIATFIVGMLFGVALLTALAVLAQSPVFVFERRYEVPVEISIETSSSVTETQIITADIELSFFARSEISGTEILSSTIFANIDSSENIEAAILAGGSAYEAIIPRSSSSLQGTASDATTGTANSDANLRAGPGSEFDLLGQIDSGEAVTVIGTNETGDWYLLESGEWIAAFLIDGVPATMPIAVFDDAAQSTPTPLPPSETPTRLPTQTPTVTGTPAVTNTPELTPTATQNKPAVISTNPPTVTATATSTPAPSPDTLQDDVNSPATVSDVSIDLAVTQILFEPEVVDAAVFQDGDLLSLAVVVALGTDVESARRHGDNFVRLVKTFSDDESPGREIGPGIYDYIILLVTPDQNVIAAGAKASIARSINWE